MHTDLSLRFSHRARFWTGVVFLLLAPFWQQWLCVLLGIFLVGTAYYRFCPFERLFLHSKEDLKSLPIKALFDHQTYPILISNESDKIIYKNKAAHEIFSGERFLRELFVHFEIIPGDNADAALCVHGKDTYYYFQSQLEGDSGYVYQFIPLNVLFDYYKNSLEEKSVAFDDLMSMSLAGAGFTVDQIERIAEFSVKMARLYGLSNDEVSMVEQAVRVKDIGNVAIPSKVLHKRGPLSAAERKQIQNHTQAGYQILNGNSDFLHNQVSAIVAYEHHERFDGTGYPNQKKGSKIHIFSRIAALADAFDSLAYGRRFKDRKSDNEICHEIIRESGKQFDPELVELFELYREDFFQIRDRWISQDQAA